MPSASTNKNLSIVDALVQLSFAVQSILARLAAENDVSVTQVRLLGILRDREPGMLEIARFLELEKSSVSGLVDRAERHGLVVRSACDHDGRAVRVSLAPRGRDIARGFEQELSKRLQILTDSLSKSEQQQLAKLVGLVVPDADNS